jgi:hypothetical protein
MELVMVYFHCPTFRHGVKGVNFTLSIFSSCRNSSVGIATHYGMDGPGIETWQGRDFTHPSRPALGPTQPSIQRVPSVYRGQSGRGVAFTTHPI